MKPNQWETSTWAIGWAWIDFLVTADDRIVVIDFTDPLAEITGQFIERQILVFCGGIAVEIAYKTDPDGDVI